MLPWQGFCQGALGQNFQLFCKKFLFSPSKGIPIGFFNSNLKSALQNWPCVKFQPDWTEYKGSSNFDLEQYRKLLDDVILTSAMTLLNFIDFERYFPEYHHAKFGGNWTTNKGKTEGDIVPPHPPPAYLVPKDPSLNRVKYWTVSACYVFPHLRNWGSWTGINAMAESPGEVSEKQKKSNDQRPPVIRYYLINKPRSLNMKNYLVTGGFSSVTKSDNNIRALKRTGFLDTMQQQLRQFYLQSYTNSSIHDVWFRARSRAWSCSLHVQVKMYILEYSDQYDFWSKFVWSIN